VQRIDDARPELRAALDALEPSILDAVDLIAGGESMADILGRTRLRTRRQMTDALSAMTSALAQNRVAAIRVLVDDENLSMTEAARVFGIPRQVLSRLYHGTD
jgi:hypothetical protein